MICESVKKHTLMYDEMVEKTEEPVKADEDDVMSMLYENNGGTVLAIGGEDFAVCLADTRLSRGYSIYTRQYKKYTKLTSKVVIASSGMAADIANLHKRLIYELRMYEHKHKREAELAAVAHLLCVTLYYRRFFPFYAFNLLVGLDETGKGVVYEYDAVGSFGKSAYGVKGTGEYLAAPVLDVRLKKSGETTSDDSQATAARLDKVDVINLAKSVMTSVAERDIYTGDSADVIVIDASGISVSSLPLRID